jgi:hypothetical protein
MHHAAQPNAKSLFRPAKPPQAFQYRVFLAAMVAAPAT